MGGAAGYSNRYNNGLFLGRAAWVFNPETSSTIRVGFYDTTEFTTNTGSQNSEINHLTESGWAGGYSVRYNGNALFGQAAWVFNPESNSTIRVGIYNTTEFTSNTGFQSSSITHLTESGWAGGHSVRYNGNTQRGQAAWVFNPETNSTIRVGFYNTTEFTTNTGYQESDIIHLTESGWAGGHSVRYNGGSLYLGRAAWVFNPETNSTIRVGFFNTNEFTSNTGYQDSDIIHLTESGWAGGRSSRFNGGSSVQGEAAWVLNPETNSTIRVGFYNTTESTRNDGYQYSYIGHLTESGWAGGHSERYNGGSSSLGYAAWVFNTESNSTIRVGFYDTTESTRNDGYQNSIITHLTESGWAGGYSSRFNGGSSAQGEAAWVFHTESGVTTRVGSYDTSEFTDSNGSQYSLVSGLNDSGYAWGYSRRYNGVSYNGQTAWLHHIPTDTQVSFDISINPNNNYAFSSLIGVTENGIGYGYYTLFDSEGANLGNRAFLWTESDGVLIMDEEFSLAIDQYGWSNFTSIIDMNDEGYFVGQGTLQGLPNGSQGVYFAQMMVPEPHRALLLFVAMSCLLGVRRRSK